MGKLLSIRIPSNRIMSTSSYGQSLRKDDAKSVRYIYI